MRDQALLEATPRWARVTLTRQTLDVPRIFHHLRNEIGFWEVGFAPVTTADGRGYAIEDTGFDRMLGQFEELAHEFLDYAVEDRHHGFSNVKDTIEEIHKGVSKAFPAAPGWPEMAWHRRRSRALDQASRLVRQKHGSVHNGLDRKSSSSLLDTTRGQKTDCNTCWARPLCAGGCYHEAHVRYGDTGNANLHYCDWIRSWTNTCLEVYGEIAVKNPGYLDQFNA